MDAHPWATGLPRQNSRPLCAQALLDEDFFSVQGVRCIDPATDTTHGHYNCWDEGDLSPYGTYGTLGSPGFCTEQSCSRLRIPLRCGLPPLEQRWRAHPPQLLVSKAGATLEAKLTEDHVDDWFFVGSYKAEPRPQESSWRRSMTARPALPKLATAARSERARQRSTMAPLLTERHPMRRRCFDIISDGSGSLLNNCGRTYGCHSVHGVVPGVTNGFSRVTRRTASPCKRECGMEVRVWGLEPPEPLGTGATFIPDVPVMPEFQLPDNVNLR